EKPEICEEKCNESIESGLKNTATSHKADELPPKTKNLDAVSEVRRQILVVFLENNVFTWLPRNCIEALKKTNNGLHASLVVIKLEGENFIAYRYDFNRIAKYSPFGSRRSVTSCLQGQIGRAPGFSQIRVMVPFRMRKRDQITQITEILQVIA
ncbi:MAG: hypothetical protein QXO15_10070, partial [Nitrososphaerota archaeon]